MWALPSYDRLSIRLLPVAFVAIIALSACGGGGSDSQTSSGQSTGEAAPSVAANAPDVTSSGQSTNDATINVTANAPDVLDGADGKCSLREAITNINNRATTYADCAPTRAYGTNDKIFIPAGTYTTTIAGAKEDMNATGDYDILKSVVIVGAGAGSTTINGGGLDRVFDIAANDVSISDVTITGGKTSRGNGGGIDNKGTLTVTNSIIRANTGGNGGGIYGRVTVTDCIISDNTASNGGGIAGSGSVTKSTISGNTATAGEGGGIFNNGTLTVTNSTLSGNNTVWGIGGGVYNEGSMGGQGRLTVTNSIFSGNTAGRGGGIGGISNPFTKVAVTDSTISGNTAKRDGGGIWLKPYLVVAEEAIDTITNCTISGNTAGGDGGGIYKMSGGGGGLTVTNSTISGNTGGGVYSTKRKATLSNTIVANQTSGADCSGPINSSGYNLSSDASCGFTGTGDKQSVNPLLVALANNGGPTLTMALLAGSPAIDTGSCVNATDQRGNARPNGATCDIGAFEYR
jgi:hypothetical protein